MSYRLGVVMDPIEQINIKKDSSFAMLLEAQRRHWSIYYWQACDMALQDQRVVAQVRPLRVKNNPGKWFELGASDQMPLSQMDVVFMRQDPPVDRGYIDATYLLELAAHQGVWVINRPDSLRDCNEKLFTAWFPDCCVPTLVSCSADQFIQFLDQHQHIVIKPLDGMGGQSVFILQKNDKNRNVIIETLTHRGRRLVMAQRFISEIATTGDKRILLIDGQPLDWALARFPDPADHRGNLAAGASAKAVLLSDRDRWLCAQVKAELRQRGLVFVGLDVIGDFITEINVTSPTGIREIDQQCPINVSAQLFDHIEQRLST